jgi:hypothetical protein
MAAHHPVEGISAGPPGGHGLQPASTSISGGPSIAEV